MRGKVVTAAVAMLGMGVLWGGVFTDPAQAQKATSVKDCDVCPEMVTVPAGQFTMGSPKSEIDRDISEGPQRKVAVASFLLGKFEVTQGQWKKLMGGANPSLNAACGDDCPVDNVSWNDAQDFIKKLNERAGQATYRLPSEAEWEYAARAGSTTPFHTGATLSSDQANFDGSMAYSGTGKGLFRQSTQRVGSFPANAFGLHDMLGNVSEWTQDAWHENYEGAPADGTAWTAGGDPARRVLRGGSWYNYSRSLRCAARVNFSKGNRQHSTGLRVARNL